MCVRIFSSNVFENTEASFVPVRRILGNVAPDYWLRFRYVRVALFTEYDSSVFSDNTENSHRAERLRDIANR